MADGCSDGSCSLMVVMNDRCRGLLTFYHREDDANDNNIKSGSDNPRKRKFQLLQKNKFHTKQSREYFMSNNSSTPVIRRRVPKSQRRRDGLIQYACDITSQNGEDGIIRKIFNDILPPLVVDTENGVEQRYCVDVGAWDGRHLSNTFSLLIGPDPSRPVETDSSCRSCSWKGVLIEADLDRFQELRSLHNPLGNICVNTTVSSDPTSKDSLVNILQREAAELPTDFDFLCIDVDGSDYWLLHEVFQRRYRPKVICIESNPTMPNDLICTSLSNVSDCGVVHVGFN